jgi:hypothetical protein
MRFSPPRFCTSASVAIASFALLAACGGVQGEPTVDSGSHGNDAGHVTKMVDAGHDVAKAAVDTGVDVQVIDAGHDVGDKDVQADVGVDAGPPRNYGDASTTYPAFTADVPQVQFRGGATLSSPQIVTITWPDDTNASTFEAFGDDIGPSTYWAQATSEYMVGPAWSGPSNHVRLTQQPIATWADTDLASWLSTALASDPPLYGLPAPTSQTIYVLYLSSSTSLTYMGQDACMQGIGGYHNNLIGSDYVYAVVLQCGGGGGGGVTSVTSAASHELVEAVTDPHPSDVPAYYGFDEAHLAWDVFQQFQDEVADACEFYYGHSGSFFTDTFNVIEEADAGADGGDAGLIPDAGTAMFSVQRTWSNAQAAAGHHPCVPAVAGPFFTVTPLDTVNVTLDLAPIGGGANAQTLGYDIKKGKTATFAVGFHSDGPTSGPWTISAVEGNPLLGPPATSHITTSIDHPTGQNGDISYVTVTVNEVDTTMNGELLTIVSTLTGSGRNYTPILISNE